jgi:hypothetical protein
MWCAKMYRVAKTQSTSGKSVLQVSTLALKGHTTYYGTQVWNGGDGQVCPESRQPTTTARAREMACTYSGVSVWNGGDG